MEQNQHTFVLCAYKESPYLEECIKSLLAQTYKSHICICTSTPNPHIKAAVEKYNLPYYVRDGVPSITEDWNFAVSQAHTPYVTIAHQDDVYEAEYTATVLEKASRYRRPILIFTDYYEIRNGERVLKNKLLKIKRRMNSVFRVFPRNRFVRRRVLSFGDPICCPAVTYAMAEYGDFRFDPNFRFACDWDAWERFSRKKGAFVYIKRPLMGHRIHEDSETTKQTQSTVRGEEEYRMLCRLWPKWMARFVNKFYKKGADSNKIEEKKQETENTNEK